jgi:CBS domain containing-hemolysin-like protein
MYTLLVAFALMAILFSFLCSLWESVLLSITPSYAQLQEQGGAAIGAQLKAFKTNIDRPLAAILTLNTIAHTVGAIGVGEQASQIWAESSPLITGVLVPAIMTLAILILSEIIPKTLGANYWKELVPFTVRCLSILVMVLSPLIGLTELMTRALRKEESGSIFSRTEFLAMTEVGEKDGVLEPHESEFIRNLLRFDKVKAEDVMTPRTVSKTAVASMTLNEFHDHGESSRFTRIPIYNDESPDDFIGYVRRDEVLHGIAEGKGGQTLESVKRDLSLIRGEISITDLFNHFMKKREHIALVVNEFGGMRGIVTLEDVIETMLGMEIVDELDAIEDMQVLARKNWEKRAQASRLLEAHTKASNTPG